MGVSFIIWGLDDFLIASEEAFGYLHTQTSFSNTIFQLLMPAYISKAGLQDIQCFPSPTTVDFVDKFQNFGTILDDFRELHRSKVSFWKSATPQ